MKKFINKILDVPKLIRTVWIILWLILIILLIMKFCFGIWYPIISNNEIFNNICNYIDNNKWSSTIIMLLLYEINSNILILTCIGKTKYSKWYIFTLMLFINASICIIKIYFNLIGLLLEICIIVISIFINLRNNNFKNKVVDTILPITIYVLLNLWQFTILIVRGTSDLVLNNLPMFVSLILQLDYYIFILITWIGVSFMGAFGWGWFWSKDITVLKAEKEKELAKENPDTKLIEKIDERIAELEKEGK